MPLVDQVELTGATSNETPTQQGRQPRKPLPVTIAASSVSQEPKRSVAELGPNDIRLEMTLKLTGHKKVIAAENVCTDLPDALAPPVRRALRHAIERATQWAVDDAKVRVSMEIVEPALEFEMPQPPLRLESRGFPGVICSPGPRLWRIGSLPGVLNNRLEVLSCPPEGGA